jgi:hypothetical protein
MRLHDRVPALAVAVLLASCQTLAGSGTAGADFARLKKSLDQSRAQLNRAVAEGATEEVASPLQAIGADLDAIQRKSSAMNLMDRENLAIQAATARRIITSTRQWVANADIEAIRSEVARLDGVLNEVDGLLQRAIASSVPSSSSAP